MPHYTAFNKQVKVKIQESRYRPGVAQRVLGGLGSQISMTFGTRRWWGQPHAPAAFTPRKCTWYSFSLGAESTPGPWYGQKEYVTEKSSDITGNWSRDRPTNNTAPSPLHYPGPHLTSRYAGKCIAVDTHIVSSPVWPCTTKMTSVFYNQMNIVWMLVRSINNSTTCNNSLNNIN